MSIFGKMADAYKSLFDKGGKSESAEAYDDEYGYRTTLDEIEEDAADDQTALLMQLNPEMRKYLVESSKDGAETTKLPPKIVPLRLLTDASTATDVIALLGMIRWAMEKSGNDPKGELSFNFSVNCKNRSNSPFLISIGDIAVEPIPVQCEFQVGN